MSITPKPRVRSHTKFDTIWSCRCDRFVAVGRTSDEAVSNWRNPAARHAISDFCSQPYNPVPRLLFSDLLKAYQ